MALIHADHLVDQARPDFEEDGQMARAIYHEHTHHKRPTGDDKETEQLRAE